MVGTIFYIDGTERTISSELKTLRRENLPEHEDITKVIIPDGIITFI